MKLTNKDIMEQYPNIRPHLMVPDFMGAFAYCVVGQNPNGARSLVPYIGPALIAFEKHVKGYFSIDHLPQSFGIPDLERVLDAAMELPAIEVLNRMAPDFICLGALTRNIKFMLLREHITQS